MKGMAVTYEKNLARGGFARSATLGIVALLIVVVGVGFYVKNQPQEQREPTGNAPVAAENESAVSGGTADAGGSASSDQDGITPEEQKLTLPLYRGTVLAGANAIGRAALLNFVKSDYEKAKRSDKLIVLYFYANWCPICREEFPKMQAAFNELTLDTVIGFRVNYKDSDTDKDEEALAREFGVGYQHTKVFLKNGQRILKAPDSWDQNRYRSEISKILGSL